MADVEIESVFGHKTVADGVKVDYALKNYTRSRFNDGGEGATYAWNWGITYHHLDDDGIEAEAWHEKKDDGGHSIENSTLFTKKWDKVGRHLVWCVAKNRQTKKLLSVTEGGYAQFEQQVEPIRAILERQMQAAKKQRLPHPEVELTMIWKWLYLLDQLGKQQASQMTRAMKDAHAARVAELENYAEKLKALLSKCSDQIWPFHAVYLAKESMEDTPLRVFLTQPRGRRDRVMIVDWTPGRKITAIGRAESATTSTKQPWAATSSRSAA